MPSELIIELRKADPNAILDTMTLQKARQIVDDWRAHRGQFSRFTPSSRTCRAYEKTVQTLRESYAIDLGKDVGDMSPVEMVSLLFRHGARVERTSWSTYRAALLWYFESMAMELERRGFSVKSYIIAMSVLIVVSRSPTSDARQLEAKPRPRPSGMKSRHFIELINCLATKKGIRFMAQSFAIVTLATGVRPCEWRDVILRAAGPADMTFDAAYDGWLVLELNATEQDGHERRTLLICCHSVVDLHIRQHLKFVADTLAPTLHRKTDPMDGLIKRCSSTLSARCKEIWPKHPNRWVTLTSLRHQAHANFIGQYGERLANEMMGAGAYVSRSSSSKVGHRSPASVMPTVMPGKDVIQRAEAL